MNINWDKKIEEPKRIKNAIDALNNCYEISIIEVTNKYIDFDFNRHICRLFPYTGWHTGKSIKDGRGLRNLLKQIKT